MKAEKKIKIAIDGPAASGKSTTAREVARRLGYTYIDSGAMYRAVTLKALRENIPVTDDERVAQLAEQIDIRFGKSDRKTVIFMDGEDVSEAIRTPEIDKNISPVAANPGVRKILVKKQQALGREGGVVMDGRDIGTVVFPDAELKIYLVASVEERARRRLKELQEKGQSLPLDEVIEDLRYRDARDMGRAVGPLKKADDAVEIDTTNLSIEEQVDKIVRLAREKIHDP
jgi:cytidylate kinase